MSGWHIGIIRVRRHNRASSIKRFESGGRRVRSGRGISLLQASMLSMAVAVALVLVWISPDARGATTATRIDGDPHGALYVSGELLVSYDPGASRQRVGEMVERSRSRVEKEIPVADT